MRRSSPAFDSETQLATAFMEHIQRLGWDCYPEANVGAPGAGRADLIAYSKPLVWVIEAKLSLNEKVCEQAQGWLGHAHFVTVLAPGCKPHHVLRAYCRDRGIGVVSATRTPTIRRGEHVNRIEFEEIEPVRLHRAAHRAAHAIAERLHPDMKRYAPGSNGSFSSPWRRTMDAAVDLVLRSPGVTIRDVVSAIKHHYSSNAVARSCLLKWLEKDGRLRHQMVAGVVRFFPADMPVSAPLVATQRALELT